MRSSERPVIKAAPLKAPGSRAFVGDLPALRCNESRQGSLPAVFVSGFRGIPGPELAANLRPAASRCSHCRPKALMHQKHTECVRQLLSNIPGNAKHVATQQYCTFWRSLLASEVLGSGCSRSEKSIYATTRQVMQRCLLSTESVTCRRILFSLRGLDHPDVALLP